jgi:tRNA (guanine37-N1)-methyltransferase
LVKDLASERNIIFVCGRYGGVDQRFLNAHNLEEISIGDYVLSGGELAAGVLIDAISRFIPGVLGDKTSAYQDSFAGGWLEHPNYTRPREWLGQVAPEILLSGNHKLIEDWKKKIGQLMTLQKRPELFWQNNLSTLDVDKLKDFYSDLPENEKNYLGLSLSPKDFQRTLK